MTCITDLHHLRYLQLPGGGIEEDGSPQLYSDPPGLEAAQGGCLGSFTTDRPQYDPNCLGGGCTRLPQGATNALGLCGAVAWCISWDSSGSCPSTYVHSITLFHLYIHIIFAYIVLYSDNVCVCIDVIMVNPHHQKMIYNEQPNSSQPPLPIMNHDYWTSWPNTHQRKLTKDDKESSQQTCRLLS